MASFDFPTLYSKNSNGKTKIWTIKVGTIDNNINVITEYGQVNGKIVRVEKIVNNGKNLGKKNETTPFEQAKIEANAKWQKQKDKGYVENQNDLKAQMFVSPMLAKSYDDDKNKIIYPAMVQRKYDGVRCIAYYSPEKKSIILQSRTGKEWFHLEHIRNDIIKSGILDNYGAGQFYLDGELYTDNLTFQEITGICRKQLKLTKAEEEISKKIEFHIYDCWDLFKDNKFIKRYQFLTEYLNDTKNSLVLVPTYQVENEKEMLKYYKKFLDEGYEGIMIRNINSYYKMGPTRSSDLQKYKPIMSEEFEIVDFTEGQSTEKGAIIWVCKTKEGNIFNIRPQGTIEYRQKLFKQAKKNKEDFIGKLLTVEFQEYTEDNIPRFPRGIEIRDYE